MRKLNLSSICPLIDTTPMPIIIINVVPIKWIALFTTTDARTQNHISSSYRIIWCWNWFRTDIFCIFFSVSSGWFMCFTSSIENIRSTLVSVGAAQGCFKLFRNACFKLIRLKSNLNPLLTYAFMFIVYMSIWPYEQWPSINSGTERNLRFMSSIRIIIFFSIVHCALPCIALNEV